MEIFLNLRDGKWVGILRRDGLDRESLESNLRHGYQASLLVFSDLDLPDLTRYVLRPLSGA